MTTARRGQVYSVDMGGDRGRHYYVVVSNNTRNRLLDSVLGAMVTSTDKSRVPSAVELNHDDPVSGWVVADIIDPLWEDEVAGNPRGVLSRPTMEKLDAALKIAFGLT
ncbi:MAG TPA: type II toxin-antitoxin system PemK/MazF family toxin [Mycobacterium sp.]|nr:type II toxin-antitoxin system PemK/MazF family toxin [Mycobacterium sp.]